MSSKGMYILALQIPYAKALAYLVWLITFCQSF